MSQGIKSFILFLVRLLVLQRFNMCCAVQVCQENVIAHMEPYLTCKYVVLIVALTCPFYKGKHLIVC